MSKPTQETTTLGSEPTSKKAINPETGRPKKTSVPADIRDLIAENLKAWMRADPNLDTQVKVSAASKVGQTTVSRILLGTTAATVDVLDAIAKTFRRNPGELFTKDRTTKIHYDMERFADLPDYEKERIEAFIKHVLAEFEQSAGPAPIEKAPL